MILWLFQRFHEGDRNYSVCAHAVVRHVVNTRLCALCASTLEVSEMSA